MRIAFTHPYCWPFLRRGNERNIDVMARYFSGNGHEVFTVSARPGDRLIEQGDTGTRILNRPLRVPGMGIFNIDTTHTFFFTALRELRKLNVDVVHSLLFTDALAATALAGRCGFATVFQMNGVAIPGISCRRFPPEAAAYRRVLGSADALITCSEYIRNLVLEHYGKDSEVIPPMVDVTGFDAGPVDRPDYPVLLAAGDFTVQRKGIRVLLEAFPLVKRRIPQLVLKLSGRMPESTVFELTRNLPAKMQQDIHLLGMGRPEDLPRQYSEASLLVLPAMGEPSGTVLMEAWAAGTPVVTTDHGGVPEFVTEDIGVLFDPDTETLETRNADGLADAIMAGLELARKKTTAGACRAHAQKFSGEVIGPKLEAMYHRIS